jgi:hypothetical protein
VVGIASQDQTLKQGESRGQVHVKPESGGRLGYEPHVEAEGSESAASIG